MRSCASSTTPPTTSRRCGGTRSSSAPPDAGAPFAARAAGEPDVRGFLHRARSASGDGMVLTHGAGGHCRMPLLVALAAAFADAGVTALRCDLPYRQARATGPPSPQGAARDRAGLRHAVTAVRATGLRRVFLGGQSYGGRMASMLVAEAPSLADALLLLSYPLHPPGPSRAPRVEHLPRITAPTLFVHGDADPFGSCDEIERARATIPAPTALLAAKGGHDLGWGRPSRDSALPACIVAAFRALVGA